jgi:hypothetical protein
MSSYSQSSGYYTQYSIQPPMYPTTQQQLSYGIGCLIPQPRQLSQYTYNSSPSLSPLSSTSNQPPIMPGNYPPAQPTNATSPPERPIPLSTSTHPSQSYHCLFPNCTHISSRRADLARHVNSMHVRSSAVFYDCEFSACNRKGRYGFSRKDKMVDHMREVHMADIPKRRSGGRR